jgi:hypothetical protein
MMANNLYLPQVDYTSRDYVSIRDDLISLIPNFTPQWTSRDSNDVGIVLLELFSYLGDLLNFQIDRAANESYLGTSTQRDTVIAIANLLNYTPNGNSPASGIVTFSNSGTSDVVVPIGTQVSTSSDGINPSIIFTTTVATTVPKFASSVNGVATTTVTQGVSTTETVGTSDGTINQIYALTNQNVFTEVGLIVSVNGLSYTKVQHIVDYGPDEPVYSTYTDGTNTTYIFFGDGDSGRVPPSGTSIKATYSYSATPGSLGNVASGTVVNITDTNAVFGTLTVTNAAAFAGGADPESTDSIRVNAPAALRTLNRAVSLSDYGQLALQVSGVAKANAIGTSLASIVLYIAANGAAASTTAFKTTVSNYFTNKMPPGASLKVLDFTPAYPYLNATVNVMPNYNASNVGVAAQSALYSLFAFDNVTFNDTISQGDVISSLKAVEGVAGVTLNDYEKLPSIYSQYATVGTAATSSTSATVSVTVDSSAGLWAGAAITSIVNSSGAVLYTYTTPVTTIQSITNSTTVVITTTPTAVTIPIGAVITVQGNAGTTDLTCAINEVPVLNPNYIYVFTTGGTS